MADMMELDYARCLKIRRQAERLTQRMWKNLRRDIEKEKRLLEYVTKKELSESEIREKFQPEWSALIDKNLNLVSPRYGLASEDILFYKPFRVVYPKSYSIGLIHYHPG